MAEPLDREARQAFKALELAERFVAQVEAPEDYAHAPAIATARADLRRALLAAEQRAEEAERERDELREDLARTLRIHGYRIGSSRPCDCSSCANARRTLQLAAPHKAAEEETDEQ